MMGSCSQYDERRVSNGKDGGVTFKNCKEKKVCLFIFFCGELGMLGRH